MGLTKDRRIVGDWFDRPVPDRVWAHEEAHLETAFSFALTQGAVDFARGAHVYQGSMFDVGPAGRVTVGEFAMLNGVLIVCDAEVSIGAYATISWNVVLMDNYRLPIAPEARREVLEGFLRAPDRQRAGGLRPRHDVPCHPVRLADNVWIGFDVCVLPGVTIGEGSVVGARSVVVEDVAPYTVVAGNPARRVRALPVPSTPEATR